ncbi:MAG: rRNA pseudouridine synthase [Ruminococcaceae bacterium]|nr:rRNA pseudouridine synthase [Oscillospiraceae bacterium]
MERIQKIIASRGIASRRAAEQMIEEGRVFVNGRLASLGDAADPVKDRITIDGKALPQAEQKVYLMLYKPRGYVTTMHDELGRKTAAELVDCGCRVYPVGRLDAASEGLLLFTNDGELAQRLMHPRGRIAKVYEVTVRGADELTIGLLRRRIELDGRQIQQPLVQLMRSNADKTTYEITIFEGRNRQIRRMCEAAGVTVARLCRVQEGVLRLGSLTVGKWRYLTDDEIASLKRENG